MQSMEGPGGTNFTGYVMPKQPAIWTTKQEALVFKIKMKTYKQHTECEKEVLKYLRQQVPCAEFQP